MKRLLLVTTLVLLTASAVGQNPYQLKNLQQGTTDVTTQTTTVNAWKYMTGSCKLGSLVGAAGVQWCLGSSDNSVYLFDRSKKQWVKQSQYGTSLISIAAAGPSNVYSLQAVSHCGVYGGQQYYGLFRWIGSWSEDANLPCLSHVSAAADSSMLAGIGFDAGTSQPALFYSSANPGGTWPNVSWTLEKDGLISVEMGNGDVGCSVDANGGMWMIYAPASNAAPARLTALPSGANRAVGCLYAKTPAIAMAWTTTTGSVYAMPLENWGTWQQVKGISAVGVTGLSRFFLFGQDLSGKPYHWNVNAPFFSATFGGQWNAGLGCPDPAHPCNSSATHTLSHNMVFKTGHGIGGGLKQKTDLFTHDIEVPNLVTNPSCDPFFGQQADPECVAEIGTTAFCNESHADVEQTMEFWVSGVSVDDEAWAGNAGHNGPYAVFVLAPSVGTWEGDVTSAPLENVCPIGNDWLGNPSGLPTCQASAVYEDWFCPFFNADENPDCLYLVNRAMGEAENGVTSPWVLTDTYRQQVDANGNPVGAPVCANAGSGYSPKEKWFGSMFFLPACQ